MEKHPLAAHGMVYLATPYSKFRRGLDAAFCEACSLAGRLIRCGVRVYSPIIYTHAICWPVLGALNPLDHSLWLPFDRAMMERSDILAVAMMEGWETSFGIRHEINFFSESHKPVCYLDPESLEIAASFRIEPVKEVEWMPHPAVWVCQKCNAINDHENETCWSCKLRHRASAPLTESGLATANDLS